jgi:molybdenum cofactor biosynthesis enzyme MoaA
MYGALTAFLTRERIPPSGIILTAVLPGGCPLGCPACIVKQRDERRDKSYLSGEHLFAALNALERRGLLGAAAIVGDEPLQAHCWPLAEAFLSSADDYGVQTAIITSGYNLADYIEQLSELGRTKIVVSLDAVGEQHDNIRRKPGAFARISEGLRIAKDDPDLLKRLAIATILMPGNRDAVKDVINFTADMGIDQLLLSPLLTSSRMTALSVHPKIMKDAWQDMPALLEQAELVGVKLRISDEFGVLGDWQDRLSATGIEILAPREPARLVRVDAAGRVETLATMQAGTTTGLQLPADIQEIDSFVSALVETCLDQIEAAA